MKRLFILAAVVFALVPLQAQRFRALSQLELRMGVGISNSLSELGGANRIGTHFYKDYEIAMTRPAANIGLRMYIPDSRWAGSFNISYARVAGRDNLTLDPYRENRNLNFRSPIVEFSVQGEYYFRKAQKGARYAIREVVGSKNISMDWYVFAGIGGFWFNPKGQYNGNWYALQPLSTEGQGVVATRKQYRRFTGCIPIGLGGKYSINNNISVGFEMGFRYTFTDYLDDVSTSYVDRTVLVNTKGTLAANMADQSLNMQNGQTLAGEQRGDPRHKDVYMMMMFNVNYKFGSTKGAPRFFSIF
jgi:hypothetical protein